MGRLMSEFDLNFYKDKKVLVTGHTGFKGSWLCKILTNIGAKVTGYSLKPPTKPSLFNIANIENSLKLNNYIYKIILCIGSFYKVLPCI